MYVTCIKRFLDMFVCRDAYLQEWRSVPRISSTACKECSL